MNRHYLSRTAWMLLLAGAPLAHADKSTAKHSAEQVRQVEGRMTDEVDGQRLRYLLYHPVESGVEAGEGSSAKKWPLVLFLHGAGERGDNLHKVKVHGPPKLVAKSELLQKCVVLSPQCPAGSWWNTKTLKALVEEVLTAHPDIDRSRLYITGLSMGGYGTWNFISEHPNLFAAAVPICGGGDPARLKIDLRTKFPKNFSMKKLASVKELPIRVYHGADDKVVPEGESRLLVDALMEAGNKRVQYTVYPGVGHNSWTRTYADAGMWQWLLAQKKSQ